MSDDTEIKDSNYINWLETSITEECINYYEYSDFKNIQQIEESVFRATWKRTGLFFALKLFNNRKSTQKIVDEIKLHKKVDFHPNILKFYGITKIETDVIRQMNNYSLVLEYADSGTLRTYLSEHFNELDWNDKYRLAWQLASAVECIHECGIIHRDLHANNILVHQKNIKLADFGSINLDEKSSNSSKMFAYIDPKSLNNQNYELNEKSDVYSIGVLMWQISSGCQPFYNEGIDHDLALDIINGKREEVFGCTPVEYSSLYQECWKYEPDERPDMQKVISTLSTLRTIISHEQRDIINNIEEKSNSSIDLNLDLIIDDISSINLSNIKKSVSNLSLYSQTSIKSNIMNPKNSSKSSFESTFININNYIVDELITVVIKKHNKGFTFEQVKQLINQQLLQLNQSSNSIVNWLLKKQIESQYIWFLGLFYYYGINIKENSIKAFESFTKAATDSCSIAQVYLAKCYNDGYGTEKNEDLAFNWYQKAVENESIIGQVYLGYCYEYGIGTKRNEKKIIYWYKKAANNGNIIAKLRLANYYRLGKEVEKDETKAFEYYKILANKEISDAQYQLGNCFYNGIGIEIDKEQAFFWYKKATVNGNMIAKDLLEKHYNKNVKVEMNKIKEVKFQKMQKMLSFKELNQVGLNFIGTKLIKKNNNKKGFNYIQKAAKDGYKVAQFRLGDFYRKGEGVEKDERKAFELYKKSAEQGYINAEFQLGGCYDKGIGTDINKVKAFELYKIAARKGNSDAQNCLGLLYENGQGTEKNLEEVIYWYNKAAEKEHEGAQYNLGRSYQFGIGIRKDEVKAFKLYKKLAEKGYVNAIFRLGSCYDEGIGTDINKRKAFKLYKKAAEKGNSEAQNKLGSLYENGQITDKNLENAIFWYNKAAKNYEIALYNLGKCYQYGIGVEKNEVKAFELYEKASRKGYVNAIFQLGYCYDKGIGIGINKRKAFELYKEVAEEEHSVAQYNLGLLYENGEKIKKDLEVALDWYQKSAENGYEVAQYKLGIHYELGNNVDKDENKAFELYEKAAKKEFIEAQYKLGNCYYNGIGTVINKNKAFEFYKKAAEKGSIEAQNSLSLLYENGEGTEKDSEMAFYWCQKSAENEYEVAQYNLGTYYELGKKVDKDEKKAFELYEKAAKKGFIKAQYKLGSCYNDGIGTKINKEKAFEFYKKAFEFYKKTAEKGSIDAQNSLALLYENGEGTEKNLEMAFYWYQRSSENGEKIIFKQDQLTDIKQLNDNISSAILTNNNNKINVAIKKLQIGKNPLLLLQKINEWGNVYKHSNIVEFLGFSIKDENQLFLIMPFANDDNLRSYIKNSTLYFNKKIEIAINIANGIMILHENNIVHENLNPKNILVFDGIAKISNLPLPYNKNEELREDLFDNIGYIDPNSFLGESYEKNKSTDIYSLGSLLWEIMSETVPYSKDQYKDILKLISEIKGGYREKDITDVPAEYINLYKNCWENRPSIYDVSDKLLDIKSKIV